MLKGPEVFHKIYKYFKAFNSIQEIKVETNLNAISKRIWQHCGTMRLEPPLAGQRGATFEGCNFDLQTENIMKGVIPMKKMILGDFNGRSALFYVIETRDFFFTVVKS